MHSILIHFFFINISRGVKQLVTLIALDFSFLLETSTTANVCISFSVSRLLKEKDMSHPKLSHIWKRGIHFQLARFSNASRGEPEPANSLVLCAPSHPPEARKSL